jgi:hypothetical protein
MPKVIVLRNLGSAYHKQHGIPLHDGKQLEEGKEYDVTNDVAKTLFQDKLAEPAGTFRGVAGPAPIHGVPEESPVSDSNADEAITQIGTMRSKDKLQHIIDNDKRVTVVDAAKKRIAQL